MVMLMGGVGARAGVANGTEVSRTNFFIFIFYMPGIMAT
jgi:hypothetical protein